MTHKSQTISSNYDKLGFIQNRAFVHQKNLPKNMNNKP
jgi:hypothetical protein